MLRFSVAKYPEQRQTETGINEWEVWIVYQFDPEFKVIAEFPFRDTKTNFESEVARALAGDYCAFLNNKYLDKEINKEWPKIDRETRMKYHLDELKKLNCKDRLVWSEDGDEVEH